MTPSAELGIEHLTHALGNLERHRSGDRGIPGANLKVARDEAAAAVSVMDGLLGDAGQRHGPGTRAAIQDGERSGWKFKTDGGWLLMMGAGGFTRIFAGSGDAQVSGIVRQVMETSVPASSVPAADYGFVAARLRRARSEITRARRMLSRVMWGREKPGMYRLDPCLARVDAGLEEAASWAAHKGEAA